MKTRSLVLTIIFSFILTACGPGQALGPTTTPSPTTTPIPTNTPMPTPTITPTPTQVIKLRNLIITNDEINKVFTANLYQSDMVILKDESEYGLDIFEVGFNSITGEGIIWVSLAMLPNGESCFSMNNEMEKIITQEHSGEKTNISSVLSLPDDYWLLKTTDKNHLISGFSKSEICVTIEYQIPEGYSADDMSFIVNLIAQKQFYKLEDMGF